MGNSAFLYPRDKAHFEEIKALAVFYNPQVDREQFDFHNSLPFLSVAEVVYDLEQIPEPDEQQ